MAQEGKSDKKGLVKAAGVVGGSTLMSRILGLVRDIVNARQFGTTWQWDAFLYAFMLPNFFRRLVGEGALSSAFIPVYSETLEKQGKDAAFRFANVTFSLLAVGLLVFLLAVEGGLAWALHVGIENPRLALTLQLLQKLFPYLILISFFALGMGVLNAHRYFFAPSIAPVLLNIFWIVGVLWIIPYAGQNLTDQLHWLAWILLAAGFVQLLVEVPVLYRLGFRFRWAWDLTHQGLHQAFRLLLPAILGFAIFQVNMLVDMTLAFMIGPGANSSLWYGARLMQFPLAIFAVAMGTALLPMISQQAAKKDMQATQKTITFSLKSVFLIILPSAVGLMVLAQPMVHLIFERGEFDAFSTARTTAVLFFYSFGLFAYSGQKIMTAGFHAVQDTKTPVKLGAIALLTNVVLNLILMGPLKEAGLALATSLAGILQFVLLIFCYRKSVIQLPFAEILQSFFKIACAALLMGFCCYGVWIGGRDFFMEVSLAAKIGLLLGTITVSILSYFLFCTLFRIHEFNDAWNWIKSRKQ